VDLNHRPLGYEPKRNRNFNNLQDAGGSQNPCKERSVSVIGQLMDRRVYDVLYRPTKQGSRQADLLRVSARNVIKPGPENRCVQGCYGTFALHVPLAAEEFAFRHG